MKNICVLCASSNLIPDKYKRDARKVGELIGKENCNLIFGGSSAGMMGEVARGTKSEGGRVIAVTPKVYSHDTWDKCDEVIITENLEERKNIMIDRPDAFLFMPGGPGTLDEMTSLIESKRAKYHNKPIVLLNISGFFDGFEAQIDKMIKLGFAKSDVKELFFITRDPEKSIEYIVKNGIERYEQSRVESREFSLL